jgi:hypothetical protein
MDAYPAHHYDICSEWIPLSNFANQPLTEICGLHLGAEGLWTFLESADSSDDERPECWSAHAVQSPKPQQSPFMSSLAVTTLQQRRRCSGDFAATTHRSYTDTAPGTAPLDKCFPADYAPRPPRRAISARLNRSSFGRKRNSYRKSISERLRKPESGLGVTTEPEPQGQLQQQRPTEGSAFELSNSFSQKIRVRKVLHARDLAKLKTNHVCFETKAHPDSATSMMSTPQELYHTYPQQQVREIDLDGVTCNGSESQTPNSPEAALSSVRTGVDDPHIWGHENYTRDVLAPGESRVYIPGPIMLEQPCALLRRDSVATMDAFLDDLGPKQRRASDMEALDQIASFFEDSGVGEAATDEGFDKFWLQKELPYGQPSSHTVSVVELEAHPPWAPRTCRGGCQSAEAGVLSRFSFSSASSAAPAAPSRRERLKRRLLLPALPGSTFLKSAGNWGQQVDSL